MKKLILLTAIAAVTFISSCKKDEAVAPACTTSQKGCNVLHTAD